MIFLSKRGLELKYKQVDKDRNVGGLPNKSRYKYKQIRDVAATFLIVPVAQVFSLFSHPPS